MAYFQKDSSIQYATIRLFLTTKFKLKKYFSKELKRKILPTPEWGGGESFSDNFENVVANALSLDGKIFQFNL